MNICELFAKRFDKLCRVELSDINPPVNDWA